MPQPSLLFQSLFPVSRFCGFSGLNASGVSFCAVVSRLTLVTNAELLAAPRMDPPPLRGAVGWSPLQAASEATRHTKAAEFQGKTGCFMMCAKRTDPNFMANLQGRSRPLSDQGTWTPLAGTTVVRDG